MSNEEEVLDKAEEFLAKAYVAAELVINSVFARAALTLAQYRERVLGDQPAVPQPAPVKSDRVFVKPDELGENATLEEKLNYVRAYSISTPFEHEWWDEATVDQHSMLIQEAYEQLQANSAVWDEVRTQPTEAKTPGPDTEK